eukprot:EG_transcript_59521
MATPAYVPDLNLDEESSEGDVDHAEHTEPCAKGDKHADHPQGDDEMGQLRSHKKAKPGVDVQTVQMADVDEVKEMTKTEAVQWASTKETAMWFSALGKE